MNVPVFIDISLEEQAEELRSYFKNLGAEISAERSDKGIEDDLHKIIGVCDACFKDTANAGQIEEVLNGIVSMLALVTGEKSENLIVAFCEKLTKAPSNIIGMTCLKVLWSLYQSLDTESPMRFHVYHALVILAGRTKHIDTVYKDMDTLKSQFTGKGALNNEQMQKLLKLLHEVLRECKRSEDASQVMIELLGTYTTENASQAREETHRCIVASLSDPNTFLLDHLLQLKPVKFLEGELIHDLLKVFVSEKLEAYQKFYENHREFVNNLGLTHEDNIKKMKLLTFMQLAETKSEIRFGEIQQHMQISEAEVEEFLIDVLKTKLVRAKIDQGNQVIHVSSTMHRTFTKEHWHKLHTLLTNWRSNLHTVREQVGHLAKAQIDLMHNQTPNAKA
jgi:translation initiation factor 3 subunit M